MKNTYFNIDKEEKDKEEIVKFLFIMTNTILFISFYRMILKKVIISVIIIHNSIKILLYNNFKNNELWYIN